MNHSFEKDYKEFQDRILLKKLERALRESIKLQAHYAKLLNMHDGGERKIFTLTEFLDRLDETLGEIKE